MIKPIAIGNDDFKEVRESDSLFIDKTMFIKDLIDDTSKVLLFPRPRRFGKSINMSMLKYYFDNTMDSKELYRGLNITNQGDKYLNEMNKYPVISLTLKEAKQSTYEEFITFFKEIISGLYGRYEFILQSDKIKEIDKEYFERCIKGEEEEKLSLAISKLSNMLESYYNEKVIVLMDEYDAPILASYLNNHYEETIKFMKIVFSSTFKGNLSLKKGIITGVLRVSKEGMFSDANNIKIYNITDFKYSNYFGFTEAEVKEVLNEYDLSDKYNDVKSWYDGYNFCDTKIYNPWSIINFLDNPLHTLDIYWVNTGGTDLLRKLIYNTKDNTLLLNEYNEMLNTKEVKNVKLDLEMDLTNLETRRNTVWTLFMLAGYLTVKNFHNGIYTLEVPNKEIYGNLKDVCVNWFQDSIKHEDVLEKSLVYNEMESFKTTFIKMVEESFSYYDVDVNNGENFYHAFVMGLLYSENNNFKITSNREAGFGRYDLLLKPINKSCNNAYIIEFKAIENNDFDETIEKAFKQIEEKKYEVELQEYNVTKIAIVFKYKEVKIEIR